MPSLTAHLLHLDESALKAATQHPFLEAAATRSLPLEQLKTWLAQDRLYALAYTNFIGALLAKVPIPTTSDRETTLEWRAVDLLIDCLVNIRSESKLFEETAAAEGWLDEVCDAQPNRHTRAYQDLFAGAAAAQKPLIVGLTVLWATEECYLRAWRHAKSKMDSGLKVKEKDVMQRTFIPNWSSPEFEAFVRRIGALVNKFGSERAGEDGWEWQECEVAWRQTMWLEKEFWPDVKAEKRVTFEYSPSPKKATLNPRNNHTRAPTHLGATEILAAPAFSIYTHHASPSSYAPASSAASLRAPHNATNSSASCRELFSATSISSGSKWLSLRELHSRVEARRRQQLAFTFAIKALNFCAMGPQREVVGDMFLSRRSKVSA
ncbi:hypothetical protein LTR02_016865 [Friedmanniomyces endolithicus]|nr:hypothetical protein LTR03_017066 [Friedmanniomyces endolithicus]KAK0860819.1 hypothetical protein LTR87_017183 [Friedmanniomyces endolithicus]KAK0887836.1 hypothetical protein LTR02_016865 [Friedmanniomyces endolithicus]